MLVACHQIYHLEHIGMRGAHARRRIVSYCMRDDDRGVTGAIIVLFGWLAGDQ